MRKSIFKIYLILSFIFTCNYVLSQNDSVGMGWVYDIYSSKGNFLDIRNKADNFFSTYPEYDTIAEYKNLYFDWLSYWEDRAHWVDSASIPGDMSSVQKAMNQLYTECTISNDNLPYQPSWKIISPESYGTQNMGVVTCSWVNPLDAENILVGTEASGLWETNNGGQSWKNLTETYLQSLTATNNTTKIPIGFGVSSICVIQGYTRQIAISTYVPSTQLVGMEHGLGILYSYNLGNSIWAKFTLPNTQFANIDGIENMNWKIINSPYKTSGNYNIIYASYGSCIYKLRFIDQYGWNTTNMYCTKVFDLSLAVDNVNYFASWTIFKNKRQKIRDMKIARFSDSTKNTLFVTLDGVYDNNTDRTNAQVFYANLKILDELSTYTNNSNWHHLNDIVQDDFVDYIAIDALDDEFYTAHDRVQLNNVGLTDQETFYFDKYVFDINNNLWSKDATYCKSLNHTGNYHLGNILAGFGYRYNAFKVNPGPRFYIGGFQLNMGVFNGSNMILSLLPANNTFPNSNDAHNNQYHYGIRNFSNSNDVLYLCTEGGISKYDGSFTNLNGNGLVIGQVSKISSSQNSLYDIIIHNSYRNGLWRYKCNTWDNFYTEDGGSILLDEKDRDMNDNGEPDFIHNITSYIYWQYPLYPSLEALHYCRFNNLMGSYGIIPEYVNLIYQNDINNSNEWNYNTPFEFSDPTNNIVYLGMHNIYQSDDFGTTWNAVTTSNLYGYPENTYWSDKIEVIKVAPSNPNIMYIAFSNPTFGKDENNLTTGSLTPMRKIFRGEKTGINWQWVDITTGINNLTTPSGEILKWTGITDIVVNPDNPNSIWITFNMFSGINANNGKFRVLKGIYDTQNNTCSWTDYTTGLTSAPVNCIVYNKYSNNDELFIGTDAGVFYRNNGLSSWQLFHINNPKWIVRDLEINYNKMMLRAGIWGRGVWETPVKCNILTQTDYQINNTISWDNPITNCGNVVINPGAILTVNANIEMAENTSITVKRGGKLIINGATIKSYCQQMWEGIVVDGDNSLSQTDWQNQGRVELNSSTIEDAYMALQFRDLNKPCENNMKIFHNFGSGGSVIANDANFKNNYCSVIMFKYVYKSNNVYHDNISKFTNCKFVIDRPLKKYHNIYIDLSTDERASFVMLNSVNGVKFNGCHFLNENIVCSNSSPYLYRGIYSLNAYFIVDNYCKSHDYPCPPNDIIESKFSGLKYGVYTLGGLTDFRSFNVRHSVFLNNKYGLYANSCNNSYLISNKFYVPYFPGNLNISNPQKYYYGAYYDECVRMLHIEDNTFDAVPNTLGGFIGLYINNSNDDYKCVYNNHFELVDYHFITRGNNGPNDEITENTGLKVKCNDFTTTNYNISIIGDPLQGSNGISYFQGKPTNSPPPYFISDPAGNTFDCCSNHDIYNECSTIKYFYHDNPSNIPNTITNATFQSNNGLCIGNTSLYYTGMSFNKAEACPEIDVPPVIPLNEVTTLQTDMDIAQQQLNSAKLIYTIWVDGGNSAALRNAINLALPYEAYELYNTLISNSPLSNEVLIDAIHNEEVLPPLLLKLILMVNPQALNWSKVWEALNSRVNPLPDEWIEEIKQGSGTLSVREQLESDIDYAAVNKQLIFNKIVSAYAYDTSGVFITDSLAAIYQRENTFDKDMELVNLYITNNMNDEAVELRDEIPSKYSLSEIQTQYWTDLKIIHTILLNLKSNNLEIEQMYPEDICQLYEIINHSPNKATGMARLLLLQADSSYIYDEPVEIPNAENNNKSAVSKKPYVRSIEKLEVYPNPATDFITLSYSTNESINNSQMVVIDGQGKTVYNKTLTKQKDDILIVLKDFAKGSYIAAIINHKKTIKSCKFVIR